MAQGVRSTPALACNTEPFQDATSRTALVVYGSETGTAQELAEELGRLAERMHMSTRVADLNSVALSDLLRFSVVLVVISTTGQGDLPANAQAFWKRLRSARLRPGCLGRLVFTSFGLGDSSYPQFNWAHRKLHNRLKQLGGHVFCDRGEADEQHPDGIDGLFLPWVSLLKEKLTALLPPPEGLSPIPEDCFLLPKWKISLLNGQDTQNSPDLSSSAVRKTDNQHDGSPHAKASDNRPGTGQQGEQKGEEEAPPDDLVPIPDSFPATLTSNKRLTPTTHWQDVRLFDFVCPSVAPSAYGPGDVLTVHPKNFPADVVQLLSLMGWSNVADTPLTFVPTTSKSSDDEYYPARPVQPSGEQHVLTLRSLLTNHLDITAIPRRSFFATLAHFTSDETQRERLVEFTSPELVDELYDYTTRPRRSILEVLQEFDTVSVPYQWTAALFPALRGRQFSIASGGVLKSPTAATGISRGCRIQLLVAIVRYRTVIRRIRQGVCTRYLASLRPGVAISVSLAKGGIKVALDKPAVMIGPGTGVAPLRSMILERQMIRQTPAAVNGHANPDQMLFFGARNEAADNFFADEWPEHATSLTVHAAFSRDQDRKVYVQDLIRNHSEAVSRLVAAGGVIYICGSSGKMPQAVREAIIECFEQHDSDAPDRAAAEDRLLELEKAGRYQQETW